METFSKDGKLLRKDVDRIDTVRYDIDSLVSERADAVNRIAEIDRLLGEADKLGIKPTVEVTE